MNEYLMPLKLKYRVRRSTTGGKYKTRTGNSHGERVSIHINLRPRRKAYGPW